MSLYFFNFDVGETCSIDLKDAFNADGVISEFYKNENRIYSIVLLRGEKDWLL